MSNKDSSTPLKPAFDRVIEPFEELVHGHATSGILLMLCALIALILANSPWADAYNHLLHLPIAISAGSWQLQHSLQHWINDALMALFFFLVGLEIKREVLVGELSDMRRALLPVVAAVGGMVVPALLYVAVNFGQDSISGWGIPMATDIAFAVGLLVLLGDRVPRSLMAFLVGLAIVDDIGAVLVIAVFYTEQLNLMALAVAGGFAGLMLLLNLGGVHRAFPYIILGVALWLAMLESGIHATLAGIVAALTIPARQQYEASAFSKSVRALMDRFDRSHRAEINIMNNEEQGKILQTLDEKVKAVESPLQRFEHSLHVTVGIIIIPLFALANAGVPIQLDGLSATLMHPVTVGVTLGLVVGKILGIAGVCWVALKMGIGEMPEGARFAHLVGISMLAGIGFTMSIFIAELGFAHQETYLLMAKTGILVASLMAGAGGYLWLAWLGRR